MINSSSVGWNRKPGGRSELVLASIILLQKKSEIKKKKKLRESEIPKMEYLFVCFYLVYEEKGELRKRNAGVFEMFNERGLALLLPMFFCRLVILDF
jgi:hypothetical protein